ncbi:DUF3231 family protein [Salipaludibacillus sp. CF4.18]|uniref:DUF3231 family protein n=1 Tax=Salipaludibacillus sp. CF4.18 TaxID=3373081 RepID=UPI003EE54010
MNNTHDTRLTSAEMTSLWTQYTNDTASKQILTYFLSHVEDEDVRLVLKKALEAAENHLDFLVGLFENEGFPIPVGFTDKDVNVGAPRLFTDTYYLFYLNHMSILGMGAGSLAISTNSRTDIVEFFQKILMDAMNLHCFIKKLTLEKGIHNRPPYIPMPKEVSFVTDQDYLGNMFGKQRTINTIEMTHVFINVQTNAIGKSLMTAFAQTCDLAEVRQYILRGKAIAEKHISIFGKILQSNDIPVPSPWDTAVTDSTVAPFSDKLMLFHVISMIAAGIGNYGVAMAGSPRKDIGLKYGRLLMEISFYAEDGANLMIKNAWMEEPPQAPDRDQLTKK